MNKRTDGKMAQKHKEEKTTGTLGRDEEVGNGMIQYTGFPRLSDDEIPGLFQDFSRT